MSPIQSVLSNNKFKSFLASVRDNKNPKFLSFKVLEIKKSYKVFKDKVI
jgi:hypothetical protein